MKKYILDACSLIAVINKESGAESVNEIIEKARDNSVKVYMNKINLLEVYYGILREYGQKTADNIIDKIKSSPISILDKISDDIFKHAGYLKANYKMSLGDSILLAQSIVSKAIVLSSDHHEFDIVEENEDIEFLWIR